MFKTKYRKCLDILDEEIGIYREGYNECLKNTDRSDIKDPVIREQIGSFNNKTMNRRQAELNALLMLKRRIYKEIGM